ncbi:MAG TPA: bifunctional UDP-N-acetylglucosamine diphosphorylase/glucosamine-1-phosphate N-acetyltransferase GlmU [Polyangiaceae bacterium]
MSNLTAVVLAAGQGTRMKSALSKVLHPIAGRPLVYYPIRAALDAGAVRVIVVVSPSSRAAIDEYVAREFGDQVVRTAVQDVPRGTGDAARVGLEAVDEERVLILCGDTPLLVGSDLRALVSALSAEPKLELALMTCIVSDPKGYGRILRTSEGKVSAIREERDLAHDAERAVREINAGVYAARTLALRSALGKIRPSNAQGEYYLTDTVAIAAQGGGALAVLGDPRALVGVNDRTQLCQAEDVLFARIAQRHGKQGVTVRGGARIDDSVSIEPDAIIEAGVFLRGATKVGRGARIDAGSVVTDSTIAENAVIKPYSVIVSSQVGAAAQIGPFAHLRPGSEIDEEAHVGNFVETKQTRLRRGAKANHLSYLGDGDVGEKANVGAGTIFCNYDGFQKHRTVIGAGAFIGSDSQLVAPVTVGENAYVATGTTVTQDVPADALALARVRQENKAGYATRLRDRLKAAAQRFKEAQGKQ